MNSSLEIESLLYLGTILRRCDVSQLYMKAALMKATSKVVSMCKECEQVQTCVLHCILNAICQYSYKILYMEQHAWKSGKLLSGGH